MYDGEPTRPITWVVSARIDSAVPKSVTLTTPLDCRIRLAGLMSRCTSPFSLACSSAPQHLNARSSTWGTDSARSTVVKEDSDSPSTYSSTR